MFRHELIGLVLTLSAYSAWSGPDPMQPVSIPAPPAMLAEPDTATQWRLNLIRQTGPVRVALLNGKLTKVGEYVDGALVTAIEAQQVTIKLANERSIQLQLPSAALRSNGE